eukprot:TRINITY_DN1228_c6_g2_i1.p1 TRINITY_DN1228_c6_g2~~TRINITY_DN1228_c6_g2_i1.p1  ORF type:complete len:113 (-),score=7.90 TRINITY_DN1228_c6_g2_i1:97-435(-)
MGTSFFFLAHTSYSTVQPSPLSNCVRSGASFARLPPAAVTAAMIFSALAELTMPSFDPFRSWTVVPAIWTMKLPVTPGSFFSWNTRSPGVNCASRFFLNRCAAPPNPQPPQY